ncbi:MAG: hypothetical protein ACOC2M_01740 [bacterium]
MRNLLKMILAGVLILSLQACVTATPETAKWLDMAGFENRMYKLQIINAQFKDNEEATKRLAEMGTTETKGMSKKFWLKDDKTRARINYRDASGKAIEHYNAVNLNNYVCRNLKVSISIFKRGETFVDYQERFLPVHVCQNKEGDWNIYENDNRKIWKFIPGKQNPVEIVSTP